MWQTSMGLLLIIPGPSREIWIVWLELEEVLGVGRRACVFPEEILVFLPSNSSQPCSIYTGSHSVSRSNSQC